jgi:polar amino acid transport system substrate-binding protein
MKIISRLVTISLVLLVINACTPGSSDDEATQNQASTTSQQSELPHNNENSSECSLTLGFDNWEPYQYADVGGRTAGLDIELVSAVTQKMNCAVSYRQDTWVKLLNDLKAGEIDILLGASKTEEREQFALFSDPYRMEEFSLYIRKDDSYANWTSVSDFIQNGSRIGIVEDYYYGPEVSMLLEGSVTSEYFSPGIMGELNIARLLDHDIDGFLEDSFVGASLLRRKALSDYIVAHGITIQTGDAYVMFSKQSISEDQVKQFNKHLLAIKNNGEYASIMNKYSQ